MSPDRLADLGAGFLDPTHGAQAVFRSALVALSHPGRVVEVPAVGIEPPLHAHAASAALMLALLDADTRIWLSPALAGGDAAHWLRFHTGCQLAGDARQAQFVWVARADALPPLASFGQGTERYPDTSATCVVDVDGFDGDNAWQLRGPGILGVTRLAVDGLANAGQFMTQWAVNHAAFPCGVDLIFAAPARIVGLPRTTAIDAEVEARSAELTKG